MEVKQKKPKDKKYNNTPEYNKKYYAEHREAILKTLTEKCSCTLCGRKVNYGQMTRHKSSKLCFKNRKPQSEPEPEAEEPTN
jgi:hypothetical protein